MPEAGAPEGRPAPYSPASRYAAALLAEFVRAGVTDIVVAPGSRSQALALAAADLEAEGRVRLHVRIDERGAGFLALGLALESGRPALVVTTSGTAAANLHPAVLEAHHAGVPLIALTADRPDEVRRTRSNQTTVQPGIFGEAVRLDRDVGAPTGGADEPEAAAALARRVLAAAHGTDDRGVPIAHPGPGPVHLNLQLREPLSGAAHDAGDVSAQADPDAQAAASGRTAASPGDPYAGPNARSHSGPNGGPNAGAHSGGASDGAEPIGNPIEPGPLTLVVAGAGAGEGAEAFAREGGWPLLAEVSSGARFGPNLVIAARELLHEPGFGDRVERVVVFGHPTLTREVPALIGRDGVEAIVVAPSGIEWFNPGHRVRRFERAVHAASHEPTAEDRSWLRRWVHASRALIDALDEPEPADSLESGVDETGHVTDFAAQRAYLKAQLDRMHAPVTRRMLVEAVWSATWPHDRLLFGASRLIRDADRTVPGRRIRVYANRGLSGIDGTVATAFGIAVASQQPAPGEEPDAPPPAAAGVTRAVIGDLTLLHDVGSLLLAPGEARPRLQLIVGNDGGGTIFDALEVAASAAPDRFDRVQYTPQSVDLAVLAAAYGWEYRRAATRSELAEALGTAVTGPSVLEVPLER
ncbi:2-succinyl-5-enolpyruvyl-6-hydroxy-3-cyclohexene-1-carboxylic-acid synthase [Agromyces intestinalis]|uniref:2-succinyl-5-enolpyruvyl-6-hydroxy-3-cyclohexene-1-carboxylate synthase n=1 Tax=Agromyces intestinalis TaxID=2592652 RepID=A0A5C1YF94_9MICO|nr:2-succinyl-5-enolpyruvyl-6-hydroxy-3-cyclohexene-1-carboxylic-acid synthase [Agromyces intestinalis]QEO14130.1 2-succinyl-5-enolpyruvyl-6-hydroxy-3-cyclohexene-1-carboxylic-acid synthase [Agromyces intestinalis]